MNVYEAIKKRRTIRKFKDIPLKEEDIMQIIDCARLAPYASNLQPLKFSVVTDKETRLKMYPHIKYAGYIPDWDPEFEETPPVFIIVLNDTNIKTTKTSEVDSGAAVAHMCLAATELGIDTCWFGSVGKKEIKEMLSFPEHLDITYVLGLGYGAQTGEYEDIKNNDHRYYFDENGNVRVPKRSMEEIIIKAELNK
ncbi:MAG: nitroreductase family protein [Clostridia bacterium]|nr:nitroreductase family protein [Clostridia bacterium]